MFLKFQNIRRKGKTKKDFVHLSTFVELLEIIKVIKFLIKAPLGLQEISNWFKSTKQCCHRPKIGQVTSIIKRGRLWWVAAQSALSGVFPVIAWKVCTNSALCAVKLKEQLLGILESKFFIAIFADCTFIVSTLCFVLFFPFC